MRWLRAGAAAAAALFALVSGCGDDEEAADQSTDPTAVAHSFLELVAAADPAACDLLTESGAELVETASGEDSCEEAIEAQTDYLNNAFFSAEPEDLTARAGRAIAGHFGYRS